MLIDTHVHFFPDSIAQKTIEILSNEGGVKPYGDGTLATLKKHMDEDGVHLSINLPIATRADQVVKINRNVIECNRAEKSVLSFGTMHPDFAAIGNVREELKFIASNGVKGIKMHPEYQDFYPDDDRMTKIYEACAEFGLIIYFHAGADVAFENTHGTPKRFAQVPQVSSDLKVVLAHMGGFRMWDAVETFIMGLHEVYLDTSFCGEMDDWLMKEIIYGHGAYKILFGTDYPWERATNVVEKIKRLNLGGMFESMIFHGNALRLLGMKQEDVPARVSPEGLK